MALRVLTAREVVVTARMDVWLSGGFGDAKVMVASSTAALSLTGSAAWTPGRCWLNGSASGFPRGTGGWRSRFGP